jgi:hypothetical protein
MKTTVNTRSIIMNLRRIALGIALACAASFAIIAAACEEDVLRACIEELGSGIRPIAKVRDQRFQGKVLENTARCRGGETTVKFMPVPWVDWSNYFGTRDKPSPEARRGVGGALIDLEYQRQELIAFNLHDNSGTYEWYLNGAGGTEGPALKQWAEMRLPPTHPTFSDVGGAGAQVCKGELIRGRTLTGICNDIRNPLMGSTGTLFARNVTFEETFPDAALNEITRNRHGDRLSLLRPDPQVISRKLFTRPQSDPAACADGYGKPGLSLDSNCDYKKAPFFNVIAAYWIQFQTHDWFSHLEEGRNAAEYMNVGCASQKVGGVEAPLSAQQAAALGCRPRDAIDKAFVADAGAPSTFQSKDGVHLSRAPKTFRNTNTAWWDVSEIYGYDDTSHIRVKRDPKDAARLMLVPLPGRTSEGDRQGYLPLLADADPKLPDWAGQESAAFPDNWTIGMSFLHTVFSREHNQFVDEFRRRAAKSPSADSGLRDPSNPSRVIRYADVTPNELYDAARLVVSAEIAKIHTIEWTPQLLYDEPLYKAMNGNWGGLLGRAGKSVLPDALRNLVERLGGSTSAHRANELYSALASGPGIVGQGSQKKDWKIDNPDDVNGGVNHFGSPFNFPEEFISVYRLHPLLPDLIEYRDVAQPNAIVAKVPIVETFRGRATPFMRERGLANWALSMGRQRLGQLALQNHPRFMQNLKMDRLQSPTQQIDLAALDLIRDRERGVPRFNEFRRQYGLRQLTSFDDFVDKHVEGSEAAEQAQLVATLRELYGQHRCDASKVITRAQRAADGSPINDCLGHPDGSIVDNVEDVDTVVGYLAETTRPHGFAISETQFVVFILNASRRLFSDRFLTSSFRPEFYTTMGVDWVNNNGPFAMHEPRPVNGHKNEPVSPLKRILLRVMPELKPELDTVINAFDPWARDRGDYYSLTWKPRKGAESDEAFRPSPKPSSGS